MRDYLLRGRDLLRRPALLSICGQQISPVQDPVHRREEGALKCADIIHQSIEEKSEEGVENKGSPFRYMTKRRVMLSNRQAGKRHV